MDTLWQESIQIRLLKEEMIRTISSMDSQTIWWHWNLAILMQLRQPISAWDSSVTPTLLQSYYQ